MVDIDILRKLKKTLNEIRKDCISLERKGYLTEYGKGELDLINKIHKVLKMHS